MNHHVDPAIYVACLASYNNAILYGKWIDASQDPEEIYKEIHEMLSNSPMPNAEEWEIHDYENFGAIDIDKCWGIEEASKAARFLENYGDLGAAVYSEISDSFEEAERVMNENYYGYYNSKIDFAREYTNEIDCIPSHLCCYIDYEKLVRDMFISDFSSLEVNGFVHVFSQF